MRKMLGIVGSLALCSAAAWGATEAPDRSVLSYDENVVINTACAKAQKLGDEYYRSCVAQQMAALKDHPTPDRANLTPEKARAITSRCNHFRHVGLGEYNDCVKQVIDGKQPDVEKAEKASVTDDVMPNYARFLRDDQDGAVKATPVAATTVPGPAEVLPKLSDRIDNKELSAQEVFQKVKHSVFVVVAAFNRADLHQLYASQGSAVAISDHLLLTNCHVVKGRTVIKIGQEDLVDTATLVAADYTTDRCVLKSDKLTLTPVAGVRSVDSLNVGEHAFAVGTPLGLELTLSEGLVSSVRHGNNRDLIQTSAAINSGSSGGGLFDDRGNLIGITSLLVTNRIGASQNFAIAAADFWK
ncbi:MAG TPA: S1C family serine protease [Stellaceae bacterium]|nr:S1C family serine protease [Stellaceae bacterium]